MKFNQLDKVRVISITVDSIQADEMKPYLEAEGTVHSTLMDWPKKNPSVWVRFECELESAYFFEDELELIEPAPEPEPLEWIDEDGKVIEDIDDD